MDNRERNDLKAKINANSHEIYVLSLDDMEKVIESSDSSKKSIVSNQWKKHREKIETTASHGHYVKDGVSLTKLFSDLGVTVFKAYTRNYGGNPHIIFKGYAGQRKVFNAVKYGASHPQIVKMGIGKVGATHTAKTGGVISIVFMSGFRVADFFLRDNATLSQLIGGLSMDVAKIATSTAVSIALGTAAATTFTAAIVPLIVVLIAGAGVSMALDILDDKFKITEKVVAAIEEMQNNLQRNLEHQKDKLTDTTGDIVDSVIDATIEYGKSTLSNWIRSNQPQLPGF